MTLHQDWIRLINSLSRKEGLDPRAVLQVASAEGLSGGVGDKGTSFGPFQLHEGGALPAGRGRAWAESPQGIQYAIHQIAQVARSLHGRQAVESIVRNFERPADPSGEIARALSFNTIGGGGGSAPSDEIGTPPPSRPQSAPGSVPQGNVRSAILRKLASGQELDFVSLARQVMRQRAGASIGPPSPSARAPQAQTAEGNQSYPNMVQRGGNLGHGLTAAPQADTSHVDPRILHTLAALSKVIGKPIQIISGYRSPAYSAKVGGYSTDPHTRGVAVDAYVGGVPIGNIPGVYQWLTAHGLESGAQPGFYRGKSDPEHVQIPGSGVNKSIRYG